MRTPRLNRDGHQWIYDWIVKETGRVFHWDEEGRELPASVKSHGQISKHLGKQAQRLEKVALKKSGLVISQLHLTYTTGLLQSLQQLSIQF